MPAPDARASKVQRAAALAAPAAVALSAGAGEDRSDLVKRHRRPWIPGLAVGCVVAAVAAALMVRAEPSADLLAAQRHAMVEEQIVRRGIGDKAVLRAMREVPRHRFVPSAYASHAYRDKPLPIGHGQTISQPYIVALMTELLHLDKSSKVLEIGTGSGYHAAVLSRIAGKVFTIEIVGDLGKRARSTLAGLGYDNVSVRIGDGYRGWPEEGPFDAILLTAAPPEVPKPLLDQLKLGGKMVVPEGGGDIQDLLVVTRTEAGPERQRIAAVRFVPMTGEARQRR